MNITDDQLRALRAECVHRAQDLTLMDKKSLYDPGYPELRAATFHRILGRTLAEYERLKPQIEAALGALPTRLREDLQRGLGCRAEVAFLALLVDVEAEHAARRATRSTPCPA